jgi:peptide/nickel transport system ATP-binding protein
VLVQQEIMQNLRELQREQGFAVLLISHDLGTVLEVSDHVLVMYAGELAEDQPTTSMQQHAIHPYTHGLLGSYANPAAEEVEISFIPGRSPDLTRPPKACPYAPRCPEAIGVCWEVKPALIPMWDGRAACHVAEMQWKERTQAGGRRVEEGPELVDATFSEAKSRKSVKQEGDEVLRLENVCKTYSRQIGFKTTMVQAVDDVSFALHAGHVTGLVGQSGSGKSTIAQIVTGIERPSSGAVWFGKLRVDQLAGRALHDYRFFACRRKPVTTSIFRPNTCHTIVP